MKFALMMDDCAINSYYIKDKVAYDFNDNPYVYHHAVSPECFSAMQNLPFIFEEGYFFNWAELDELPDVDFDLIFDAVDSSVSNCLVTAFMLNPAGINTETSSV